MTPLSTLPVTTVPLPDIENTSSTGIRKSPSVARSGCGKKSSIALTIDSIEGVPISEESPSRAFKAEPLTKGILSPSNS